jgi:acetylornithine deacetylase/succinyl-diaminopimelate desuccinylase-like protein
MTDGTDLDRAIDRRMADTMRELERLCSQPSISAQDTGIREMAGLVEEALGRRGFSTRRAGTSRHPAILAESRGRGNKSVLFYNHYDVQPPEPLDQWVTPPFQPTVRDGSFFARGAMDDKGHLACRLAAIDAVREVYGDLPYTVRFLIEGEEEIASPSLETVIRENREALAADLCLWEFGEVDAEGLSMQYLGFRGILYVELSLRALSRDCHSGIWGTLLPNAAWRLNWALSRLKGIDEKIAISGFYDSVVPPSDRDMQLMDLLPVITDAERAAMGARQFILPSRSPSEFYRNAVLSPSCTICGLTSGYQGEGQKTIIPATATAKLDFRLVPNQTPEEILDKLRAHLDHEGFGDIQVTCIGRIPPSRTPVDHPAVRMVAECAREVYGRPQRIFPMSGGSGPAHYFRKHLGVPVLTAGVGYLGSNIHAPNEHIRLADFRNGIRHTARIMANLGKA